MDIQKSDHFDGTLFFNPEPTTQLIARKRISLFTLLKWRLQRNSVEWPAWPKHVENKPYPAPAGDAPSVTFIGHAAFLLRLPGLTILTDPVFSKRCSPFRWVGPKRVRAPGIALKDLPHIDLILLSHNHYDHMDLVSLRKLRKRFPDVAIVTTLGNAEYLAKHKLGEAVELDWWQSVEVRDSNITVVPARHFAARWLNDRNKTLWGGMVIAHRGMKIYFAGDTGYTKFFKEIAQRCGPPDLALLPIGAYAPRSMMGPVHMNPAEAVQAFQDLGAKCAIGMHFGTFRLTAEPIDAPLQDLATARAAAGISPEIFRALDVGESVILEQ